MRANRPVEGIDSKRGLAPGLAPQDDAEHVDILAEFVTVMRGLG